MRMEKRNIEVCVDEKAAGRLMKTLGAKPYFKTVTIPYSELILLLLYATLERKEQ